MKRIFVFLLLALAIVGQESQAASGKERAPKNGESNWVVKPIDGDKIVWYSFRGEMYGAPQFINVLSVDLNCKEYELDFVVLDCTIYLYYPFQSTSHIIRFYYLFRLSMNYKHYEYRKPPDRLRKLYGIYCEWIALSHHFYS